MNPFATLAGKPLLEVRNLKVALHTPRGIADVITGVSFQVGAGERVAIVGESGSGKSMTARAILGLLPMHTKRTVHGEIIYGGMDLLACGEPELARIRGSQISVVFQDPATYLNPRQTIRQHLEEAIQLHRKSDDIGREVREMAGRVGLRSDEQLLSSYPHELSGGMRQRVMIAMALACRPKIVIADEPTTALDVTLQMQIMELFKTLCSEMGAALVLITHDMGLVAEYCDRMVVMRSGQVVETGDVMDTFAHPKHPYTSALLSSVLSLEHGLASDGAEKAETAPARRPLIRVEGLSKLFSRPVGFWKGSGKNAVRAVDDVSLEIRRGEILALVGESGSGKSTTGRLLLRLLEPSRGSMSFQEHTIDLSTPPDMEYRRSVQVVFQDPRPALNPRRTIYQSLRDPLLLHALSTPASARSDVLALLDRVGLAPAARFADRLPRQLSGGQLQRVCIARAISLNPSLVIADEAVSSLDASSRAQILDLLLRLKREDGLSMLFITHDLGAAKSIANRLAVMYLGRIVEQGDIDQVLSEPAHPYTRLLLASTPIPDPRRARERQPQRLSGEIPTPANPPSGCHFHPRCPDVMDICRTRYPQQSESPGNRSVCCHLYPRQQVSIAR